MNPLPASNHPFTPIAGANTGNNAPYGSSCSMKEAVELKGEPITIPPIDNDHIRRIAITKGAMGEADIMAYHIRTFHQANAELMAKCQHFKGRAASHLQGYNRHIRELSERLARTQRYLISTAEGVPWNTWSGVQVGLLVIVALFLMFAGLNNYATVLQASGMPMFEKFWRCFLFTFIPVGLAVAYKHPPPIVSKDRFRTWYVTGIWVGGVLLAVLWTFQFAKVFPALTQPITQIVNGLSLNPERSGMSNDSNAWFITCSILAECLLAASCAFAIEAIIQKHQMPRIEDHRVFEKIQADLNHFHALKSELEEAEHVVEGKQGGIDEGKQRYVQDALGHFHAAVAAATQGKQFGTLFKS